MSDHALCHCGGGWTFDFAAKRVYCRTCESATPDPARLTDSAQGQAIGSATDRTLMGTHGTRKASNR